MPDTDASSDAIISIDRTEDTPVRTGVPLRGDVANFKELTPLQRVARQFAQGIAIFSAGIITILVIYALIKAPETPKLPAVLASVPQSVMTDTLSITNTLAIANARALIDNYKALNDAVLEGPLRIFDQVVVNVLLIVFTTTLGYIFGAQSAQAESDSKNK